MDDWTLGILSSVCLYHRDKHGPKDSIWWVVEKRYLLLNLLCIVFVLHCLQIKYFKHEWCWVWEIFLFVYELLHTMENASNFDEGLCNRYMPGSPTTTTMPTSRLCFNSFQNSLSPIQFAYIWGNASTIFPRHNSAPQTQLFVMLRINFL